ncbi:HAD-IA family hydrolase [Candidatus Saccharibacteria bacterium]|nr:HAD-IA family hydrolase [Candidatus Saccharibacteria bacterium]
MVILSDLSELFVTGILMMHVRVSLVYGRCGEEWFVRRKERMNPVFLDLMRGSMKLSEFWEDFCDDYKKPPSITPEGLNELFLQEIQGKINGTLEVFEGIIAYPNSFRHCDRKIIEWCPAIIMVSDHIRECVDVLHRAHPEVFDLFSNEVWSFDRGEIKSDPGFFDHLLRDLGLRARDTLFVDDLLVNCESAAQSHIKAIRFTSVPDLIRSLENNRFVIDPRVKAKYLSRES